MPIEWLPVGTFYLAAVLVAAGIGSPRWIALLTPVIAGLATATLLDPGTGANWEVMEYTLAVVQVDRMSLAFVGLFHLAALLAAVYSLEHIDRMQAAGLLSYVGSGIGAVLAGDLVVLWMFWEMLALTSVLLIWAQRTPDSLAAGLRYLVFNITSGVTLLAGIVALSASGHSIELGPVALDSVAGWLVLIAFGIKAGFPLLHNWIPDGYPNASLTGSVVLVAITTKVGVYALARVFAGEQVLMVIGTLMVLWPLVYTLVGDDLRRVLAYSLMIQIGLMVVGIGAGNAIALDGVTLHVIMDVLFKMLLFMAMGAVLVQAGSVRASELGGLAARMPWTLGFVLVGVLANSAVPGTGAFISKKLLLGGIEHTDIGSLWYGLLVSLSALGLLYVGVRIVYEVFLRPAPSSELNRVNDASFPMRVAMGAIVVLLLVSGCVVHLTDPLRPFGSDYEVFTVIKIVGQFQLLLFALLALVICYRFGMRLPASSRQTLLDSEWIYRRAIPELARRLAAAFDWSAATLNDALRITERKPGNSRVAASLARSWPTGSMAFWAVTLLAILLFTGFWQG